MTQVPNLPARGILPPELIEKCQSCLKRLGYGCGVRLYIPASETTKPRRSAVLTRDEKRRAVDLVVKYGAHPNDVAERYMKTPSYIYRLVRQERMKEKHDDQGSTTL